MSNIAEETIPQITISVEIHRRAPIRRSTRLLGT